MKVEKRDGTTQTFNFDKIERVVFRVYGSIGKPVPEKFLSDLRLLFDKILEKAEGKGDGYIMSIEDIQDIIRDQLIKKNQIEAAESFILYRKKREEIRDKKSWINKEITRKLKGNDIENQTANLDEASFGGRIGEAARVVTKDFALKNCMSKTARKNHEDNVSYIHNLKFVA